MEAPIQPTPAHRPAETQVQDEFSGTEGVYLLPHHHEEIERLQRQHYFLKAATDDKLTPINLPTWARVLDCGCADGTWLADLAGSDRPDLALHGVDLGKALFRSDAHLTLREHDVRQPFPPSWGWKGSFDLVHQRLLVWGIGADEWPQVLANLAEVVKPGGVLQLVEAEWVLSSYSDKQVQQKKLAKVQEWSTASSGMDVHIWKKFPDLLLPLGFEDMKVQTYDLGYGATSKRPEDRIWTAELLPQSFRHLARKIPAEGIPGVARTPDEYLAWLDELVVEMKQIGYTPKV
ncbi:class I SAM-dependent methyltransferase [Aspergillus clavatus NRRL 1]|uniref:Methyltransferase, putative n=1 Tax=Aspergillus clavatus (strain ATCC 1007 / CBS 513.65 / DSM 816 / NCTC 3887 / NRRL 1 / QM 1276 / 107) TaxID=344612 RepID=A1CLQ0_ASPCL|nr:methyltransferase, putative [Aspergillus clavatus NRRL 1]EAW09029.1 methyltransferase, putative [Aspergillus clavatus NRRL 1]